MYEFVKNNIYFKKRENYSISLKNIINGGAIKSKK